MWIICPLIFLKCIHLATRIIIYESLFKEKKNHRNLFRKEGKGGGAFLFNMTLGSGSFKGQVFSVNLVILKKKQDHIFLTRYKEIKSIKTA